MTLYKKSFTLGDRQVTIEHGEIGRQADATVMVNMEETIVMTAVTARKESMQNATFLPLTVDYQEKYYAAGRIPGSFFRREGRPSETEILISRLIDRSLRPLFPDFFYHEVQVVCTVLSFNPEVGADIPALLGAAAAIHLSGIPFGGPVAAVKVGYVDDAVLINPTTAELQKSRLSLVVSGTEKGVLMVESEARELPETVMLDAVMQGHREIQKALAAIKQLGAEAGKPQWEWTPPALSQDKKDKLRAVCEQPFSEAYSITEKQARSARLSEIRGAARLSVADEDSTPMDDNLTGSLMKKIESKIVRERILGGQSRIDGRGTRTVRPINIRLGILPRAHGSALFTRGETQAIVVTTLGSERDEQKIDALPGEEFERFMLHYNFPPYSTGETGRVGTPKRREIGHGRLAKRGLKAVMPHADDFGFSLRIVSEITESNGSSSMATICGGSLSLMDAGVPIAAPVSGIAMGLIKEDNRFAVLSDILGDEDHLGDMDFKVAGTANGVTALQMDLKIDGINETIMRAALEQAKEGRLHILEVMNEAIAKPREDVSSYAPRMLKMKIPVGKIRDVIGKGGSVIRDLTSSTGAKIDVEDDGSISISGGSLEICEKARDKIEAITSDATDLEVGKIYEGKVEKILENVGAVVSILPGRDGLVHISQISNERIQKVSDHLQVDQSVRVKVIKSDEGRVRFSMRDIGE